MKLLLQQLGTLGEVLDCTTLCKPSPHPCLPRANHTHLIWLMGRGALLLLGFITFWFFSVYSLLVNLFWGPKPGLGSVSFQIPVGLWWCFVLQRCWQQEITRNLAEVPVLAQLVMIPSGWYPHLEGEGTKSCYCSLCCLYRSGTMSSTNIPVLWSSHTKSRAGVKDFGSLWEDGAKRGLVWGI